MVLTNFLLIRRKSKPVKATCLNNHQKFCPLNDRTTSCDAHSVKQRLLRQVYLLPTSVRKQASKSQPQS